MEQDKSGVPGQPEEKELGGEVSVGEMVGDEGLKRGDASPEKEDATAEENAGHGDAAAESKEGKDLEDASAEESEGVVPVGDADHRVAEQEDEEVEYLKATFPWVIGIVLASKLREAFATAGSARDAVIGIVLGSMNEAQGSTVVRSECEATADNTCSDDGKSGTGATNAPAPWEASSALSHPLASRGRKRRRPEHEEAEAQARSKVRRGNENQKLV